MWALLFIFIVIIAIGVYMMVRRKPVKTGIADGASTEIQDGLKEGEVVITGLKTTTTTAATAPAANPFGPTFGGPRR